MTYSFIPNPNDDPRASQARLLTNFSKINADFSINHVALTQATNQGYHTLVQFPDVQLANPNLASPQSSIYTKLVSGIPQLFFQNGNLASNAYQLTQIPVGQTGTDFSTLTPWGIRIQMGSSLTSPVTFQTPFLLGFTLYTALATSINGAEVKITSITNTTLTYTATTGTQIYYMVFGTA